MAWVDLVTLLALLQYFGFGYAVGSARGRYGVKAPAISGNDVFERYFRAHQNTLEQLILFVPALWMAARYWNPLWVAGVGALFIVGRALYFTGYVRDPRRRELGFFVGMTSIALLWFGTLFGAVRALL